MRWYDTSADQVQSEIAGLTRHQLRKTRIASLVLRTRRPCRRSHLFVTLFHRFAKVFEGPIRHTHLCEKFRQHIVVVGAIIRGGSCVQHTGPRSRSKMPGSSAMLRYSSELLYQNLFLEVGCARLLWNGATSACSSIAFLYCLMALPAFLSA